MQAPAEHDQVQEVREQWQTVAVRRRRSSGVGNKDKDGSRDGVPTSNMFGILERGQGLEEEQEQRKNETPRKVGGPLQQQITVATQLHESLQILQDDKENESL